MEAFTLFSALASAITLIDTIKKYSIDRPEEYKQNDVRLFQAYLLETKQEELKCELEHCLTMLQSLEDSTNRANLKLDKLLEYALQARNFRQGEPKIELICPDTSINDFELDGLAIRSIIPEITFKLKNVGNASLREFSYQVTASKGFFEDRLWTGDITSHFINETSSGEKIFCIDERTVNRIEPGQVKSLFSGLVNLNYDNFSQKSEETIEVKVYADGQEFKELYKISDSVFFQGRSVTKDRFLPLRPIGR